MVKAKQFKQENITTFFLPRIQICSKNMVDNVVTLSKLNKLYSK